MTNSRVADQHHTCAYRLGTAVVDNLPGASSKGASESGYSSLAFSEMEMVAPNDNPSSRQLKLFSLEPLVFQCSECGERFDASGSKTMDFLTAEVYRHNRERHSGKSADNEQRGKAWA